MNGDHSFFSVQGISKRFGGLLAVDGVSFDVSRGEIFTIIGPNGAGKSTIFNLISLIYPLSTGTIRLEGTDITGMSGLGVESDDAPAGAGQRHEPAEAFGRAGAERHDGERRPPAQAPAQQVLEEAPAAAKPPVPLLEVGVARREPGLHQGRPRCATRSEGTAGSPSSNPTRERTM